MHALEFICVRVHVTESVLYIALLGLLVVFVYSTDFKGLDSVGGLPGRRRFVPLGSEGNNR